MSDVELWVVGIALVLLGIGIAAESTTRAWNHILLKQELKDSIYEVSRLKDRLDSYQNKERGERLAAELKALTEGKYLDVEYVSNRVLCHSNNTYASGRCLTLVEAQAHIYELIAKKHLAECKETPVVKTKKVK